MGLALNSHFKVTGADYGRQLPHAWQEEDQDPEGHWYVLGILYT